MSTDKTSARGDSPGGRSRRCRLVDIKNTKEIRGNNKEVISNQRERDNEQQGSVLSQFV